MNEKDVNQKLISEYQSSINRTRRVFLIINVISIVFLIAYFNHRLTWLKQISPPSLTTWEQKKDSTEKRGPQYLELYNPGKDSSIIDIRKQLTIESQTEFKFVKIGFVGTKIFVDDLPIIGGLGLIVVLTWFYYVVRRETGITYEIRNKVLRERSPTTIEYLFYGTAFSEIFNSIKGIDDVNQRKWINDKFPKFVRRIPFFAPAILLSFIVGHDLYETMCVPIEFNNSTESLYEHLVKSTDAHSKAQFREIFVRLFFSVLFIVYSFVIMYIISLISNNLKNYQNDIAQAFLNRDHNSTNTGEKRSSRLKKFNQT